MNTGKKPYIVSLISLFLFISIINNSLAQGNKSNCPIIRVSSPMEVSVGDQLVFVANVQGGDAGVSPTYNWSVSAGTISSGQGTSVITLSVTDAESGQSITATVELGGYSRECQASSSSTTFVKIKSVAKKVGEYRKIKLAEEHILLDNFTIELQSDPMANGYIISYAGVKSVPNTAITTAMRAKKYLIDKRGVSAERIIIKDGGYRQEEITELFIAPSDAVAPIPEPTVIPPVKKTPAAVKKAPVKAVSKTKKT